MQQTPRKRLAEPIRLPTIWDDGKYIWHYFTGEQMAKDAALIPGVVESSPNSIWRSRVATTARTPHKEEPKTVPGETS